SIFCIGSVSASRLRMMNSTGVPVPANMSIPCSPDNPEFCWVYDTEVIRDLIAPLAPVRWDVLTQEGQHRATEILESGVALVVSGVSVHQAPQSFDRVEMRAVGWDKVEPDPAVRHRKPGLNQFRVMVSGIVQ